MVLYTGITEDRLRNEFVAFKAASFCKVSPKCCGFFVVSLKTLQDIENRVDSCTDILRFPWLITGELSSSVENGLIVVTFAHKSSITQHINHVTVFWSFYRVSYQAWKNGYVHYSWQCIVSQEWVTIRINQEVKNPWTRSAVKHFFCWNVSVSVLYIAV